MTFGLKQTDLDFICIQLRQLPEIEQAVIFGSRALGTWKNGSDIDLAIIGDSIDFTTVSKLHSALEYEGPLPYLFDIVDYTHLTHDALKEHIDANGICIYKNEAQHI